MLISIKCKTLEDGSILETMQTVDPLTEEIIESELLLQHYIESRTDEDKITCRNDEELNEAYKVFKRRADHGVLWNPNKIWSAKTVEALWELYLEDSK